MVDNATIPEASHEAPSEKASRRAVRQLVSMLSQGGSLLAMRVSRKNAYVSLPKAHGGGSVAS